MPNRIIHEKATVSATLDIVSADGERMFWRLTTKADDHGRFDADPRVLLAACFPRKVDKLKPATVERWRDELACAGLVTLYTVGDRIYGAFIRWFEYQRQRDSKPKYPAPEHGTPYPPRDAAACGVLPQDAAYARAGESGVESRESRAGSREPARMAARGEAPLLPGVSAPPNGFHIPDTVTRALDRVPRLGRIGKFQRLRSDAEWWQAQVRAFPELDLASCVLKAESWLTSHPEKAARKKDAVAFLHNWFKGDSGG